MLTHLHLIVFDAEMDGERLTRTLADFRKFTGRQLCDYCAQHAPKCVVQALRELATADQGRRFWQPSRQPETVQEERLWQQKVDYLRDNPCRMGLVRSPEQWRFSSALWYWSEGAQAVDVPLTATAW